MASVALVGLVIGLCGVAIGIVVGVIVCSAGRAADRRAIAENTRRATPRTPGRLPPPIGSWPRPTGASPQGLAGPFTCRVTGRVFTGDRRALLAADWRLIELVTTTGREVCAYAPDVALEELIDDLSRVRVRLGGDVLSTTHFCDTRAETLGR